MANIINVLSAVKNVITSSDITKAFYNKVILLVQDFCILLLLFFLSDYNKFIVIVPMSSL